MKLEYISDIMTTQNKGKMDMASKLFRAAHSTYVSIKNKGYKGVTIKTLYNLGMEDLNELRNKIGLRDYFDSRGKEHSFVKNKGAAK